MGPSQLACRGHALSVDPLLSGSRSGLSSFGAGYGPCRQPLRKLKVFGGAQTSHEGLGDWAAGAPCSSTSEQLPRETAVHGTSAVQSLARLLNMEGEDDHPFTFEQKTLFDLCSKDLTTSCQRYGRNPTLPRGHQLLMDLKRMQNLIQSHLSVPGEVDHTVANIFVVSQCLTCILQNPRNLCYGNAPWRCWCWTGAFADDVAQAWGHTTKAVRHYLSENEPQLLPSLPGMQHIWAQFDQDHQADAVDFLHALWTYSGSSFFAGRFFHRSERGHTEEREQFPLNFIFPDGDGPITLDTLVNFWADEGQGQFLYGSPGGVVINLQRSTLHEGTWTKHHRELEIDTKVNLPFSEDGSHVHMAKYHVVALVLHQGATHENGHYQTILAIDNIYWLADDGTFPSPLPQLTSQQRREISQIWLVAAPTDELVPDTAIEVAESLPKKPRFCHETLHITFSNITFFGKKVQDWVWTQGDTIMLFQETHLQRKALDTTLQYFNCRGWKCHGVEAEPTGNGGATGGFLTLFATRHLIHHVHTYTKQGNGWTALVMQREGLEIYLIQLYLRTGEPLQSPLNADLLGQLLQFLDHLQAPFIIGGDWQTAPEDLAATTIPSKFRAQILATPGPTTLQGSQLDFILASTSIASALRLEADWEVPWKPHCALALHFDCAQAAVAVQQLQRFPPITRNYHPKHLWTSFTEEDGPFHILGQTITGLGSDLARWATQTEKYLTQHLTRPVTGRGSQIQLRLAPLASSTKPRVWKKGSAAFWEKLGIKINLAQHGRYPGLLQDLKDMATRISQHASQDLDCHSFEERLLQWIFGGDPDPSDLLQRVQHELQLAQEQLLSATNHEFREWLEKAHDKGLRGLFRSLRQKDHAWQRPFQDLPSTSRIHAREQQWGDIWIPRTEPLPIRGLPDLKRAAQAHAQQTKAIDSSLLQKLMRRLPNKAAGPDGISYDFLRHLPYPAVEKLASLLTEMEQEAELPLQLRHTNIVMIPKNERIERPIALTSCIYRLWNSYRKHDLHKWQLGLDKDMPWDHARPHKDCLSIAVGRMLKAEIGKHQGIHTVTCLADLTCFYDTVQLDHLIEPATELDYPPLHLKLALDLYTGPRLIQAEGIAGDPKYYEKGILQGCPQAPAIAKLVLYRPLRALVLEHPAVLLQTWVDDVSYDIKGTDPDYVAREAVLAFRTLQANLAVEGLKLNTEKTGFITSSKESAKALDALLRQDDPKHHNILRDLGIDATNSRRRRITQIKKRFLKGRGRVGIMLRLKLGMTTKYRLHRGAIHPVMSWGAQANGLAPQRRQQLRVLAARGLGLQRSGSVDVVFDIHSDKNDPGDSIILQHIHTVWKVLHSFDDSAKNLFWISWNSALDLLLKAKHRWQVVTGPLQALQAYLLDYDFDISNGKLWKRTGYGGIPDCTISLEALWPEILHKLTEEFHWQRLLRLTRYEGCHDLERKLDWSVSKTLQKMTSEKIAIGIRALHQGTLHGQTGKCPLCGVELTFIHLLWECSFWEGRVQPLPDQWRDRIQANTEPELWNRGMTQSIFYIQDGGMATFSGEGLWADLEACSLPAGHAVSLAVAPTSRDPRHRRYVFAICIHQVFAKERVASLTGICPGKATRLRALFYGLKHLSLHIRDKVHVAVFQHSIWKNWSFMPAHDHFPDLSAGLEHEDFDQVRLLLFSRREMDSNLNRKAFQQDTQAKATQAALLARPEEIIDLQKHIDEDTRDVLSVAGNRMNILLTCKEHFLHNKSAMADNSKIPMVQQKKDLLACFLKDPQAHGHQWEVYRSGVRCSLCRVRFHTKSLIKELQDGLTAPCAQAVPSQTQRKTRFEIIHDLLESQGEAKPGTHHLRLEKAYLRCNLCRSYVLARAGEDIFNRFLGEVCHHGPLASDRWHGHSTHQMHRTGNTVECQKCHARSRVQQDVILLTDKLRRRCPTTTSLDIRSMLA